MNFTPANSFRMYDYILFGIFFSTILFVFVCAKLNANVWNISHNAINAYFALLAAYATRPNEVESENQFNYELTVLFAVIPSLVLVDKKWNFNFLFSFSARVIARVN